MAGVRRGPGSETIVRVTGDEVRWATKTYVPRSLLDANARERALALRSLPDSKGGWQKVATVPLAAFMDWLPKPADWQDWKYLARKLNDPDVRAFRTDGDHRKA